MTAYIIHRLAQGLIVIVIVSILIFLVMRLLPGDPLTLYVAEVDIGGLSEKEIQQLMKKFGLDKSLPMQYFDWVRDVLHGDLGESILFNDNVGRIISRRLPVTLHLGGMAFLMSGILGVFFGVICALRRGKWLDTGLTIAANIGITIPSFWVGILLIYVLALKMQLLPVFGYTSPLDDFWMSTRQSLMPTLCLSFFSMASITRQARSSMLEIVQQDYIRTAWAKGLRERVIILRHAIKNAFIPVVTVMGTHIGIIFGGSVLIETVFSIPGMGRMMTEAVFGQDYQVVQAGVLIISLVVVTVNLVVDISYGWFDPRIRYT
jgi:peptide/nickel transport system permease protein